jgi:hypothetical protein
MNWAEIIAGLLFLIWPLTYRHQVAKIHDRMQARGRDTTRFDESMSRPFFRAMLWVVPVLGVAVLIAGLAGE